MKISLSFKEIKEMKEIIEAVEKDSSKAFIDSFKKNKLITCNVDMFNQKVVLNIKEEYIVDFFAVYGKYTKVLVSQTKAIMETVEMLGQDTARVVEKYTKEEKKVK